MYYIFLLLRVIYYQHVSYPNPRRFENVKIGGNAIDLSKTYRFTVPGYNAAGGNNYPNITTLPTFVDTGYVDTEVLKDFIEENSPINTADFAPKGEVVYK